MSTPIIDFSHLSPAERIELAEQLWDSLGPREREDTCPTEEQLAELRRRRAALDADGDPGEPWDSAEYQAALDAVPDVEPEERDRF